MNPRVLPIGRFSFDFQYFNLPPYHPPSLIRNEVEGVRALFAHLRIFVLAWGSQGADFSRHPRFPSRNEARLVGIHETKTLALVPGVWGEIKKFTRVRVGLWTLHNI